MAARLDPEVTVDAKPPFAPAAGFPPVGVSGTALADAAWESMEAEWAAGNPIPAAWYLERAPALAADQAAALDLAYLEYVLRQEAGEDPSPEEYAARFPDLVHALRKLLALDTAVRGETDAETVSTDTHLPSGPAGMRGRYLLVSELGAGGQADVYLAVHPTLGREVVLKQLKASEASAEAAERLRTEGRILAGLDHPNLAKVYDLDVADGRPFVVLELIRGRTLHEVRRHAPVSPADAARWVAAVARAAHHAHARGVLHLDIKPRNVVLDADGRPVLLDFGLAKLDHGLDTPAEVGVSGTLAYMAPEQARGEADRFGPPTDVYGLGGVLFYLLTGANPIPGNTASEVYAKARDGDWARPLLAGCDAPGRLKRLCERALAANPAERFHSADAFADALEAAVRPRRRLGVAALAVVAVAAIALVIWWPSGSNTSGISTGQGGEPRPGVVQPKPELRLAFDIHRTNRFFDSMPTPFHLGERGRVRATIPAGSHAALLLVTEQGTVKELTRLPPEVAEVSLTYPHAPDPKKAELLRFAEPAGTHVFLLAVSPAGPLSAEQLGLKAGEPWPRLPSDSVIRLASGRAEVVVKGRDVEPGGAVADPEGEVVARLQKLVQTAPPDATVEAVVFGVKER